MTGDCRQLIMYRGRGRGGVGCSKMAYLDPHFRARPMPTTHHILAQTIKTCFAMQEKLLTWLVVEILLEVCSLSETLAVQHLKLKSQQRRSCHKKGNQLVLAAVTYLQTR